MAAWTSEELSKIGTVEELQLASLRGDGTLRKPVTVWVVRVGDDLYVRAYKGRTSPWFVGMQARHEGHVQAGGVEKDVNFVEVDGDAAVNEEVDAACRSKYRRYASSIVGSVVTQTARAATLKLVPQ